LYYEQLNRRPARSNGHVLRPNAGNYLPLDVFSIY
jgi:hypothetical protein